MPVRRIYGLLGIVALLVVAALVVGVERESGKTTPSGSGSSIQHEADNAPRPDGVNGTHGRATPSATKGLKGFAHSHLPARKYAVLIVLDGAEPSMFHISGLPHVRALIRHGTEYTNAWAGILESETPSGHAAIGTGSEPKDDGILSFDWANSDNTQINLFDPSKIRDGDMERLIAQSSAPTIAELVHANDRQAKVVALGGHKYYAVDAIGGPNADAIMYYTGMPDGKFSPAFVPGHAPPSGILTPDLTYPTTHVPVGGEDHLAMKLARKTFKRMHEQVALINLPEFDWPLGHVDGGTRDMKDARLLMRGFDSDLAKLEAEYAKAGALKNTVFVLLADHGMAHIYHTVAQSDIQKAVEDAGTSIIDDTYHTATYVWIKNERKANAAALNIAKLRNPYIQSVYFRSAVPGGGWEYIRASGSQLLLDSATEAANQYLLNTFNGPVGPDLAVFYTEDSASLPGGESNWKGDHGGSGWDSQHLPLIISGAGVRRAVVSSFPARLEDVAPTLLTLIGVPHTGMEGTPLADALEGSTPLQMRAQSDLKRKLMPVVTALQRESKLEIASGK